MALRVCVTCAIPGASDPDAPEGTLAFLDSGHWAGRDPAVPGPGHGPEQGVLTATGPGQCHGGHCDVTGGRDSWEGHCDITGDGHPPGRLGTYLGRALRVTGHRDD
jgi:hypothetical protein